MIYQQQSYGSRPLSNGLVVTVTPSTSEMSNSSVESSSSNNNNNNNNNANFLATKLRKIKENLDNSYMSHSPAQNPSSFSPQPSQTQSVNGNYSHIQTNHQDIFLTPNHSSTSSVSSIKRFGNNSNGVLEFSNDFANPQQQPPTAYHPHSTNHRQSMPPLISNTSFETTTQSSDSMSKYLQLNKYQTFDFELNNNKLSLDHILDQFDGPTLVSNQNNHYQQDYRPQKQQHISVNKTDISYDFSTSKSNGSVTTCGMLTKSLKSNETQITQPHLNNINEKAIDYVIPVYREIVFNPYGNNASENIIKTTPVTNQMVTFKNYSNINGQSKQQNGGNEAYLKKAVYTENVSRQSSIRSLLSNISEASNPNKPVTTNKDSNHVNNNIESPLFKKGAFFYSNGDLNFSTNANNETKVNGVTNVTSQNQSAKIKKSKANTTSNSNLLTFMPVTKKEVELLNDWDTFRPSPVKIINNATHFSQGNNNGFGNSIQRPTTRLELRDDIEMGSNLADSSTNFLRLVSSESSNNNNNNNYNNNNKYHNNKPNEYSDNVTVASSTSSGRYFQDEECESVLVTPTNEKEFFILNKDEQKKTSSIEKHNSIGNETESVLSAFAVNNLTFEDIDRQTPNMNNNDRKYSKDNNNELTCSEVFSENSYVSNNSPVKNSNQANFNNSENSFKEYSNHNSNNSSTKNDEITITQSPIAQEFYHNHHHHYSQPYKKSPTENFTNVNLIKTESTGANEKIKNYQRLSHSINNVFSNLLQELDKQKNKDFGQNLNKSLLIHSLYSNEPHENSLIKNQIIKLSNSSNAFNKEADTTININSPTRSYIHENVKINGEQVNSMTENDTSLIERYLTNEQAIAFKHSQVENVLRKYQNKNLNIDNDYAIIEYILNQEGISKSTFKQLIREKFYNIDWSDSLLTKLHEIINHGSEKETGSNKRTENTRNGHEGGAMEESVVIVKSDEDDSFDECANDEKNFRLNKNLSQSQFNLDKENKANTMLKQGIRTNNSFHDFNSESQNSPSSSKSYRKIKDIKNATNFKKNKQNFGLLTTHDETQISTNESFYNGNEIIEGLNDHFNSENIKHNLQENLKKNLSDSFAKRRERKGSLPEINTSHMNSFYNFNYESKNNSCLSFDPNSRYLSNSSAYLNKNDSTFLSEQSFPKNNNNDNKNYKNHNQRYSRKSAFVLEVLRTSMFRSKSLTDLNGSIVKYDNSHNTSNHNNVNNNSLISNKLILNRSINTSNNNLNNSQSISLFNINSSNLFKTNFSINENYTGLIWQCADMCYTEYRNKYKELEWLMNASDNYSTSSKLKEVEQRLKIEINLKEKNLALIENDDEKNSEKIVNTRVLNQLKLIHEKISELERMRLYLRICEINSHGLDNQNLDIFFNHPSNSNQENGQHNSLQAKTSLSIFKTLYGTNAICSGFAYQFFVVYRYICSSIELFIFFKESFLKARNLINSNQFIDNSHLVIERTINLISMWIDGFYIIDFQQNSELLEEIEKFLENSVRPYDESKFKVLTDLLQSPNLEFNLFANKSSSKLKDNSKFKKTNRLLSRALRKKKVHSSSQTRNRSRSKSNEQMSTRGLDETEVNSTFGSNILRKESFFVFDFPVELISNQLTLIEWANFLDIHVCHCLNSKAQGVNCDSKQPIDPNSINSKQCLFVDNYLSKSVYKMIQFNYLLAHWVSAEILLCDNLKGQVDMITKFLKIAKNCYTWSNFSTSFSIYDGLQDITIRNLPAWQQVSSKMIHVLEKISSFKLLFKNDPDAINNLSKTTSSPVIPPMHLFLLIVQQNEHGNFKTANGQWKWSKLAFLANLVDQIRNIQQHYICNFEPSDEFVEDLLQRIYYLKSFDLNQLAENNLLDYHNQKFNMSSMSTIKNLIPIKKRII